MSRPPLVIASSLTDQQNERLAAHPSAPVIVKVREPWQVPAEAQALFTYQTQWRSAPAKPPAGWPGALAWAQIASAGVDTFPRWFFEVPLVSRGRGVQAPAIAEYVIAAVMAHEKRFWDVRVDAAANWRARSLGSLAGKTLGIAGMGAIGEEVGKRALALGMRVIGLARSRSFPIDGVERANSFEDLLADSDHVVLAMPLTEQTRGIVNRNSLQAARRGLHLVNVARGALIDDAALVEALDSGQLGAATLDVTNPEPLPADHPFYRHPLIRLTPHISGSCEDGEERLSAFLASNLSRFIRGERVEGVVDPMRAY